MTRRKRSAVLIACAGLVAPIALATSAQAATNVGTGPISAGLTPINLLNINDFHGRIDGGNIDGKLGLDVACTLETAKSTLGEGATLFLSGGDNVGASVFASSIARDEPTIAYLNALQLRASSVGNHEFDSGYGDLTTRIESRADFDYLGANVYRRGTTTPALKEYSIQTVNGVRVGVIGAVTQQTPSLVSPAGVASIDFGDPVAAVNRVANQLTDGNAGNGEADVLVAEYHDGASTADSLSARTAADPAFAHLVNDTSPKVSVVFNGHTHQLYAWDGPTAPGTRSVIQSASYGAYIGQVQLGYDPATKTVREYRATNVKVAPTTSACAADPQYAAASRIVGDAIANAKVLGRQPVGRVSADVTTAFSDAKPVGGVYTGTRRDDRGRESTLGNLSADAWLAQMNVAGRTGAEIGIQNPGGVRSDLFYEASGGEGDGVVTYAEAASVNPFANTLQTIDITGAQFKQLLEQQWQPAGSSRPFLKLATSRNVRYTYDPNRAQGDRITGVWYDDKPMSKAEVFTVASGSFLIGGGDNFTVLQQGTDVRDSGIIDTDAFINHLSAAGTVSPDRAKRAVAVLGPTLSGDGSTRVATLRIEGVDLTSLGSPANTRLTVTLAGVTLPVARVVTERVETPLPTRDGTATIRVPLDDEVIRKLRLKKLGTVEVTLTAEPSGTRVSVPVTIGA